ncbi:MAG TPA: metalloregulator ArsR/SmtB family transcription factor [Mycobacteriales bacterium]|nr:metalloregulator ArsR/SmtB family transcription factor [Mycobacteriales bacterium]
MRAAADIRNMDGVKIARPAPTRDEVARLLLEQGPATAAALGERLGISPTAVRRHLDALVADGLAVDREQRPLAGRQRGRGRPAREFLLTDAGRASFPHAYDGLATAALRYLAETAGESAVAAFAERRVGIVEERHGAEVRAADPADRIAALADALTSEGYAASAHDLGAGGQLCQHHCPVAHVAAEFPQLCEAETRAFERLLGTHVQRLATIARGDAACTTYIPTGKRTTTLDSPLGRTRA